MEVWYLETDHNIPGGRDYEFTAQLQSWDRDRLTVSSCWSRLIMRTLSR